jgi:OmpA-OmpF porin, OOP family
MMFRFVLLICFTPAFLLAQLNSAYDEQSPVLHPSQQEFYFTIAAHPQNVAGKRDAGDIWVSKKEGNNWGPPALVKGLVNNGGYNAVLGFSEDGDEMFLYGHYTVNGDAGASQGISVSRRNGNTWSLPRNETIPYFLNKSVGSGGHITPDKKIFVFSADGRTYNSFGNEDIYVSFNREGVWTEPLNLGATVNTSGQEFSPYYQSSTSSLFFSSNKAGGQGSFDVYRCDRLDDTWQNWSPAQNEGAHVNTEGRELYFRLQSNGYAYTSTLNSDGYGDIRQAYYPSPDSIANQTLTNIVEDQSAVIVPNKTSDVSGILLNGRVVDAETSQGIFAKIAIQPEGQNPINSNSDGRFNTFLSSELAYSVSISALGYISLQEPLVIHDKAVKDLEINFKLQPVAVGVSVNLKHVLFRQSSPELLPESYDELDKVVEFLTTNATVEIELSGHTDDAGKASLNLKLSRDRVNRVKYYLVEKGIAGSRVKGVGYGETRPIASNKTDEGRKMNRRVEFKILKK